MLLIRKLDNRSYQGHWSAWRLCLLKKSSTRGVKTLIWLGDRFHPFFSFQSSLMLLWNRAIRYIWSWFCLWKCYNNTEHSHVVFHRKTWKGRKEKGDVLEVYGRVETTYFHETASISAPDKSQYPLSWRKSRNCTCKLGPSLQQIGKWIYQTDEPSQIQEYSNNIDVNNIEESRTLVPPHISSTEDISSLRHWFPRTLVPWFSRTLAF